MRQLETLTYTKTLSLPRWHSGKESACQCKRFKRRGFDPWVRKIPWRRKWQPALAFLPGQFPGQRSPEGYRPWGHRVSHDSAAEHTQHNTSTLAIFKPNTQTQHLSSEGRDSA